VRRCLVGVAGFIYGLGFTWVCMVLLNRFGPLHDPHKVTTGCHELGKCATSWLIALFLTAYFLGPAVLFAALNGYAWQRWTTKKWTAGAMGLMVLTAALYAIDALI
jgi:hypothetical protein